MNASTEKFQVAQVFISIRVEKALEFVREKVKSEDQPWYHRWGLPKFDSFVGQKVLFDKQR